ncbi:MAG: amidohydrolase [Acidobacteriaceae bacterium]|nr:amidohydrolase [Acidobacteriaceae bacterium]
MRVLLVFLLSAVVWGEDLVIRGGRVWTGDETKPFASTVVMRDGRILAVGGEEIATPPGARVVDAKGRLVTPGFNDAHLHFLGGALGLREIDLTGICTLETIQKAVGDFVARNPGTGWVTGRGWEYLCFPGGKLPVKEWLDAVVKDRPVFLSAYDGHTAWVNSKALAMAGVTAATEYKGFGEVVKNAAGEPAGALKEGAQGLVRKFVPRPDRARNLQALADGMPVLARLGITSMQNASGDEETISLFSEFAKAGKLTVRTAIAPSVGPLTDEATLREWAAHKSRFPGPDLRVAAIKLMMDGVIESHTAAMLAPYSNKPGETGKAVWTQPKFNATVALADQLGLQIFTHAIGDRAVRMALDGYEHARRVNGARDSRFRIEHIETIASSDIPRFAALGVLPSMEPIHADPGTVEIWSHAIGPARLPNSFAWRSLEKAGARLVFSSDWPASISLDPIRGMHNAVNRQTTTGLPAGGWLPAQRVSVETALRAYTVNGAYASFEEQQKGQIKPGMLADMVILSQDLFRIPPADIHKTRVDVTVFNGRVIYTRN